MNFNQFLGNIRIGRKLLLICVSFSLPIATLLVTFINEINGSIERAQLEMYGDEYQRPLERLLKLLSEHNFYTLRHRLEGDPRAKAISASKKSEVDRTFDAWDAVDRQHGARLQFTAEGLTKRGRLHIRFMTVKNEWANLGNELTTLSPKLIDAKHQHLIADLRAVISHMGDTSNLILDPDLDSYYMMDVTLLVLPETQERLARVIDFGWEVLKRKNSTQNEKIQLAVYANSIRVSDMNRVSSSLKAALNEDANFNGISESMQRVVPAALDGYTTKMEAFCDVLNQMLLRTNAAVSQDEFLAKGFDARAQSFLLWEQLVAQQDILLRHRIDVLQSRKRLMLLLTLMALSISILLSAVVTLSVTRPVSAFIAITRRVSSGDLTARMNFKTNDEIGMLSESFDAMAAHLQNYSEKLEQQVLARTAELQQTVENLKQAKAHLSQSEKMSAVGQLAAGVAHEINNPLGVILGFAQAMASELPAGGMRSLPIKSIEREALRCKALVQSLLTFSRTAPPDRVALDINETVAQALTLIEPSAKIVRVAVSTSFAKGLPLVLGNKCQFEQVIMNLAKNALDAMPNGGSLTLSSELVESSPHSWVYLRFVDDGTGIPPGVLSKIFDPFFTTKPLGQGTGLGLSLVSEIMQKHSGMVLVESRPGRTEFTLKLPVRTGQELEKRVEELRQVKIAVVDRGEKGTISHEGSAASLVREQDFKGILRGA